MRRIVAILLAISVLGGALSAAELAGVTMPDTIQVGDQQLVLNGMGLRKKAIIKVYVAGLYLPQRVSSADSILGADGPRRTVMDFRFGVGAAKMCEAWNEGLENNTPGASAEVEQRFETLCGFMDDMDKGDTMVYTYLPGSGTQVEVKGSVKGKIEGKAFADALWACWIGPEPPGESFKDGLLGR